MEAYRHKNITLKEKKKTMLKSTRNCEHELRTKVNKILILIQGKRLKGVIIDLRDVNLELGLHIMEIV